MSFKRKFSIFAEMKSHNSPCIFFSPVTCTSIRPVLLAAGRDQARRPGTGSVLGLTAMFGKVLEQQTWFNLNLVAFLFYLGMSQNQWKNRGWTAQVCHPQQPGLEALWGDGSALVIRDVSATCDISWYIKGGPANIQVSQMLTGFMFQMFQTYSVVFSLFIFSFGSPCFYCLKSCISWVLDCVSWWQSRGGAHGTEPGTKVGGSSAGAVLQAGSSTENSQTSGCYIRAKIDIYIPRDSSGIKISMLV